MSLLKTAVALEMELAALREEKKALVASPPVVVPPRTQFVLLL